MRYKIKVLRHARYEYVNIVDYLAKTVQNKRAARSFKLEFRRQLDLIAAHPFIRPLSQMRELAQIGYRSCPVGPYILLYKVSEDTVEVAHIFHHSQDYARLV